MNYLKLIMSLSVCFLAAFLGSIFTTRAIPTWYETLNKPFFTPPSWLFAPAWTILFILMGISLYLIWTSLSKNKVFAIKIFFIQLALNILWSLIFFGLKLPWLAFGEIILLWFSILATIIQFGKISRTADSLLVPYLLWVSFAAVLNLSVAILN